MRPRMPTSSPTRATIHPGSALRSESQISWISLCCRHPNQTVQESTSASQKYAPYRRRSRPTSRIRGVSRVVPFYSSGARRGIAIVVSSHTAACASQNITQNVCHTQHSRIPVHHVSEAVAGIVDDSTLLVTPAWPGEVRLGTCRVCPRRDRPMASLALRVRGV